VEGLLIEKKPPGHSSEKKNSGGGRNTPGEKRAGDLTRRVDKGTLSSQRIGPKGYKEGRSYCVGRGKLLSGQTRPRGNGFCASPNNSKIGKLSAIQPRGSKETERLSFSRGHRIRRKTFERKTLGGERDHRPQQKKKRRNGHKRVQRGLPHNGAMGDRINAPGYRWKKRRQKRNPAKTGGEKNGTFLTGSRRSELYGIKLPPVAEGKLATN